ncbi:MAG: 2-oxoglutarate dehydrogenase complex dihydrolipoyllysine-residue succinyltransferase [Gammaproteobacteria bacterium]|nr:2-oxoglutarate dehydrogenase complex dihydrolipoyllysine-residue succinyltransferase [Gammaproteobacteria bacterium]
MTLQIKVPVLPESVADATVVTWHKQAGDTVKRDEILVDLETDKVVLEVPAPEDGILETILKPVGAVVTSTEVLATFAPGATTAAPVAKATTAASPPAQQPAPAAITPSARRAAAEADVNLQNVVGSGKGGRVTKEDVSKQKEISTTPQTQTTAINLNTPSTSESRPEKRVPMTRLRARIAERLLQAKNSTALLTSFNEINMQGVIEARTQYKELFEKKHGVKLGFMSFFTRAVTEALKNFPVINASLEGNDIVYHGYYDIGIAVSTERGLVVPVLRDTDTMSYADIEKKIAEYGQKARTGQLSMEEITGGTFTITNGGVFGSLLSTPIINPPQSAILGLHKIQERPIVENGHIVIRPMMYVALSYDHRLIDGKDSVQFLVTIKNFLEDPSRLLLDI